MTDLRMQLLRSFERLHDDLAIERYGDPHVAFAVLVYPDRCPLVVAVTPVGSHDLSRMRSRTQEQVLQRKERFFDRSELQEAGHALTDAAIAMRLTLRKPGEKLGDFVTGEIERRWRGRRDGESSRLLEAAANEAARPAICPHCHGRFTERGIKQHLARSAWCSKVAARTQPATEIGQ